MPASEEELQAKGYNRYHCYSIGQIQLFEAYLAMDAAHSIQSCATIWGSELPAYELPETHEIWTEAADFEDFLFSE